MAQLVLQMDGGEGPGAEGQDRGSSPERTGKASEHLQMEGM